MLLNTAIEHRLMHAETLAYMLHQLPLEKKTPQPQPEVRDVGPPPPRRSRSRRITSRWDSHVPQRTSAGTTNTRLTR